jgi:hypothetical protein
VAATVVVCAALASVVLSGVSGAWSAGRLAAQAGTPTFGVALAALAGVLLAFFGFRHRRQFGLRLPAGWKWLAVAPAAVVAGAVGGAWVVPGSSSAALAAPLFSAVLLPLAAEGLGRGLVLGTLAEYWPVQRTNGPWFVSRPVTISAVLTAVVSCLYLPAALAVPGAPGLWAVPVWIVGAIVLGLACGMVRERSRSLLPPVVLHVVAAVWAVLLPGLW